MRILKCLLVIGFISRAVAAESSATPPAPINASMADAFVDTIGVNIHLGYNDTVYKEYEKLLKPRLIELGLRHIRDGVRANRKDVLDKLNDLAKSGIKSNLLVRADEAVAIAKACPDSVESFEGRNEPDGKPGWEAQILIEQKALYEAVKGDEATKKFPVLVSPMANTRDSALKLAKAGSVLEFLDYGNTHSYPGGMNPISGGWGISLDKAIENERAVSGQKPIICTETGYHNRLEQKGHPGVSELAAAKYQPRLLLTYFQKGFTRCYLYEFFDLKPDPDNTDIERHFGQLHNDGSPKPAFIAVKNMIALLKDPGPAFEPKPLDFSLNDSSKTLRRELFQKRDGRYYLALWQEVVSYDTKEKKDLEVAPKEVTLKLGVPVEKAVWYTPSSSADAKQTWEKTGSVTLKVTDEVSFVELTPTK